MGKPILPGRVVGERLNSPGSRGSTPVRASKESWSPVLVVSIAVLAMFLPATAKADPAPQAPNNEACVDVPRPGKLEEFQPIQLGNLADSSETSSISVLELSTQIPRKARKPYREAVEALLESRAADAQWLLIEALRLEPKYFQASTLLAALFFNSRGYSTARIFAERAHKINPQYLPALEILGALDVLKGEYPKAIAELSEVVRLSPRRQAAHRYLGVALLRQGQCADASRHFKTVADMRLNPPKYKRPFQEPATSVYPPARARDPRGHH